MQNSSCRYSESPGSSRTAQGAARGALRRVADLGAVSAEHAARRGARPPLWPLLDLMVGKIGFSYEPIQAFPSRQGCTPESYELVATFISV